MIARAFLFVGLGCALAAAPAGAIETREVLGAVVRIESEVPAHARTAEFLGTHREASGVVIDDNGLVLTIGYIILEAMAATVSDAHGHTVSADILAYDYDTGFGLVRALGPIDAKPLRFGDSDRLAAGDRVLVVGADDVIPALVARRDTFAGYWEYLLESAIYTAPPHPDWAGAALVGADGRLLGVGSLYLEDATGGAEPLPGNMFVPIDLLKPILGELLEYGRGAGPPRPWMGLFTRDVGGHVVVARVMSGGPGEAAGVGVGELITRVAGERVRDMADLFRKVWALGSAGVEVPLTVENESGARAVVLRSANRYDYLRLNPTY